MLNLVYGEAQVPCYFIFGASIFDNGNNNALVTAARANYPPYGIDFPKGSTGRFTNGRNMGDLIAEHLGFDDYIPPFASVNGQNILKGVNYASGSAGILDNTAMQVGARIGMNLQLRHHQTTISSIERILGDRGSTSDLLNKCMYTVEVGNNDYINNYFSKLYPTRRMYTPEQYATLLIQQYSQQLKVDLDLPGEGRYEEVDINLLGDGRYEEVDLHIHRDDRYEEVDIDLPGDGRYEEVDIDLPREGRYEEVDLRRSTLTYLEKVDLRRST
ncbi:hypothetical protein LWI29_008704 [Acer saccharum]|uniref:GDSL esterase/lipase n=1 Tax=Acer saccharum TaxID=4024 RepID=A0AA39VQD1_ACESA|nr:hypothetical protein LWI29_008704 [Acer saccharum]